MMNRPLDLVDPAARRPLPRGHEDRFPNDQGRSTVTHRQAHVRARRLARALTRLGVVPGERVGTLAWNGYRHFELYYAVSGMEAVIHTINPRLCFEQLTYIVHHAEDRLIFFDLTFLPLVEKLAPHCPGVTTWIAMTDRAHLPSSALAGLLCYEDLLAAETDDFDWPEFDENTAAGLCYTSGTTGHPKGVLFSHRSSVLHAYAVSLPDVKGYSARSVVLPIVPMFHVNAWGIPYAAPLSGAKLVFPGAGMDGASLYELFETEQVESSAGVPTVWLGLIAHMKQHGLKFSTLKCATIGGSAVPPAMVRTLSDDFGLKVLHGWGMTEMSPGRHDQRREAKHDRWSAEDRFALSLSRGDAPGVEMKIVDAEGSNCPGTARPRATCWCGPWIQRGVLSRRRRQPAHLRRLASHRRRRDHRRRRLPADHGPLEGHDQVRRGVDQLDRAENIAVGHPRRRGGRDRRAPSALELERCSSSSEGWGRSRPRIGARLLRARSRSGDAGRRRVRRRAAAYRHRQAVEERCASVRDATSFSAWTPGRPRAT
jgi:acyl-CoA synthetase (AMP-forming)/AMP-acid ligase II